MKRVGLRAVDAPFALGRMPVLLRVGMGRCSRESVTKTDGPLFGAAVLAIVSLVEVQLRFTEYWMLLRARRRR